MKDRPRFTYSKVIIFSVIIVLTFQLYSCKNNNQSIIPYVYVDFTINLNDPMFNVLNAPGNAVIITSSYAGTRSAGYNNHGIIVYRYSEDIFYAFDRTCPFEESKDQAVNIENTGDITAECPHCHTEYVLPSLGYPDKGPGHYPLKQYKTSFDGVNVHVYN